MNSIIAIAVILVCVTILSLTGFKITIVHEDKRSNKLLTSDEIKTIEEVITKENSKDKVPDLGEVIAFINSEFGVGGIENGEDRRS